MRLEESKIKSVLKMLMKKQGLQYKDLAQSLRISEATVKRRLNKGELGISQVAEIAECLGVSFYEILEMSQNESSKAYLFTEKQEKLFAADLNYLMLFRAIIMGLSFAELEKQLGLKKPELRKKLRHLEEVQLIKLMPQDRIVMLAAFPFKWRENGALQKAYFSKNIASLFSHAKAKYSSSTYQESSGSLCKPFEFLLSSESKRAFSKDLMEVYSRYMGISQFELKTKSKDGSIVSGVIFADEFSIWKSATPAHLISSDFLDD